MDRERLRRLEFSPERGGGRTVSRWDSTDSLNELWVMVRTHLRLSFITALMEPLTNLSRNLAWSFILAFRR